MTPRAGANPALGPPLRIRRRTEWERAYLARAAANVADLLRDWQPAELAPRLANLALDRSPYYRELLHSLDLAPSDLATLDDLVHFPTLDRATLGARWRDLPTLSSDDNVVVLSSGTTGDPVHVVRDAYDTVYMWAVLRFFAARLAVTLPARPRVVLLDALPSGLEYSVRLRLVDDGALHRISLVRPDPLARLRRAQPSVICTDPAGLHWLAAQPDPPQPRLILTSAQHFPPAARAACARTLAAPVVNYLATTETGPIAWECLAATETFHVLAPDMHVESLDGELAVTRLRASVLPLLRYRLGDRGAVARAACACGFSGQSITGFTGRRACWFTTPAGLPVDAWQLAWLFKAYPLARFRLTQIAPANFTLELVAGDVPADLVAQLREALLRLGWPDPEIDARIVDSLAAPGDKPAPFRTQKQATGDGQPATENVRI